jgi:transcriptional regulator
VLEQDAWVIRDTAQIRNLIQNHPWVTLMSSTPAGPVVSHLPVLVESSAQLVLLGHLPKDDARAHQVPGAQSVLVFQGEHGYISPSWYEASPYVPTWNYEVVHAHGDLEPLSPVDTLRVLQLTTERFEPAARGTWRLDNVESFVQRLLPAVVGFRMAPTRLVAKAKMSQDKPPEIVSRVVSALEADGPYRNAGLAAAVRRSALPSSGGGTTP